MNCQIASERYLVYYERMRESIRSENLENRPALLALYKFFEKEGVLTAPRVLGCIEQFAQGKSGLGNDEFSMELWRLYKVLIEAITEANQVGDQDIADQCHKEVYLVSLCWRGRGRGWLSSDSPPVSTSGSKPAG